MNYPYPEFGRDLPAYRVPLRGRRPWGDTGPLELISNWFDHDCARCEHRRGCLPLEYIDDLDLWCRRGTILYHDSTWLGWIPPAGQLTARDVQLERDPVGLQALGRQIIAVRHRLREADDEREGLVDTVEETRSQYSHYEERILQMIRDLRSLNVDVDPTPRQRELEAEQQQLIPVMQQRQRGLLDAEDAETITLEQLHMLRLQRGCRCCNPALGGGNRGIIVDLNYDPRLAGMSNDGHGPGSSVFN